MCFHPENTTEAAVCRETGVSRYDEIVSPGAITSETVKRLARECGFELAGVAPVAAPEEDFARFERWIGGGMAGKMGYLTDRRAEMRRETGSMLPSARSVICVGKLYNPAPFNQNPHDPAPTATGVGQGVISRYAVTRDYHEVLSEGLLRLAEKLLALTTFDYKICVDTAPLLERSYARQAGLGWIGRNTCLINEPLGSWFLLGELITSMELAPDSPPPDRCGTCTRCIDACPTRAIVPSIPCENAQGPPKEFTLDARRCISYLNIELKGDIPQEYRAAMGNHVFGCDICQEVCPWNARAPVTADPELVPLLNAAPPLEELARLSEDEFRERYGNTPVTRSKYDGFMRNVAVAMGASGDRQFYEPLERLAKHSSPLVAAHAQWAKDEIDRRAAENGRAPAQGTPVCAEF